MTTENNTAATAIALFFGMKGETLEVYDSVDLFKSDLGAEETPIEGQQALIDSDVPVKAIIDLYNRGADKKVRGFKDRKEAVSALFSMLEQKLAARAAEAEKPASTADQLAAAVKPAKAPKAKKEKAEGEGTGRASPLAKKFWSRSGNAIRGRRLGGTGVGIQALQYIINNPGCSTEDYLANSGGGRYVDLQYDLDYGNIVALNGATPEERQAEIAELAKGREAAEAAAKAEAEAAEKAKAEKKAKKEAEAKEKAEKKAAEKKAADEKAAAEKAALEKAKEADAAAAGQQA